MVPALAAEEELVGMLITYESTGERSSSTRSVVLSVNIGMSLQRCAGTAIPLGEAGNLLDHPLPEVGGSEGGALQQTEAVVGAGQVDHPHTRDPRHDRTHLLGGPPGDRKSVV